ncbi:MAG: hypothetical protein KDD11_07245 [Acidobacteria bacterium]|nr:hypothetical protein [Acidobacteriota bacterium]
MSYQDTKLENLLRDLAAEHSAAERLRLVGRAWPLLEVRSSTERRRVVQALGEASAGQWFERLFDPNAHLTPWEKALRATLKKVAEASPHELRQLAKTIRLGRRVGLQGPWATLMVEVLEREASEREAGDQVAVAANAMGAEAGKTVATVKPGGSGSKPTQAPEAETSPQSTERVVGELISRMRAASQHKASAAPGSESDVEASGPSVTIPLASGISLTELTEPAEPEPPGRTTTVGTTGAAVVAAGAAAAHLATPARVTATPDTASEVPAPSGSQDSVAEKKAIELSSPPHPSGSGQPATASTPVRSPAQAPKPPTVETQPPTSPGPSKPAQPARSAPGSYPRSSVGLPPGQRPEAPRPRRRRSPEEERDFDVLLRLEDSPGELRAAGAAGRRALLTDLTSSWAPRRAMHRILEHRAFDSLSEALSLIELLPSASDRTWCLLDLLETSPLAPEQVRTILAAAPSPAAARRLEARRKNLEARRNAG